MRLWCILPDRYITKIDSSPSQHQVSDGMSEYFLILKVLYRALVYYLGRVQGLIQLSI